MTSTTTDKSSWGSHGGKPTDFCMFYDYYGHNNIISQRNYPCDNHMIAYFGTQFDEHCSNYAGFVSFRRQLCQCMIFTMIWIKSFIEEFRSGGSTIANVNDDNHATSNPLSFYYRN